MSHGGSPVSVVALVLAALIALETATRSADAAAPGSVLVDARHEPPVLLRGYGRVGADGHLWSTPAGEVARVVFTCQSPEKARAVASKYLADLLAYGAVSRADPLDGIGGTVLDVRHGGCWLLALDGAAAVVFSAPSRPALAEAIGSDGKDWQPVPAGAYPRFLDNFDNAGLGIWWMPTTKTAEQLAWMESMPVAVNIHQQTLGMAPAAGVADLSGVDNALVQIRAMHKPYRHMFWCGEPPWRNAFLLPGERLEQYPEGFIGRRFFEASGYQSQQVASPDVNAVGQSILVQMMRRRAGDPELLGWMEPHGEFYQSDPAFVPPGYRTRFPAYLQIVKHYSLETISEAYTGERRAYATWQDVPYPDTAWFAGRRGRFADLDDVPWRWQPATLEDGEKAGWEKPGFDDAAWRANLRADRIMLSQVSRDRVYPLWLRFTHAVPADLLAAGRPVYLHICPYTEGAGRETTVWVNGQELCRRLFDPRHPVNRHIQLDVSKVLQPGDNRFVIFSNGGKIGYRVFLSDVAAEPFPFSDVRLNRRFLDWRDYTIWEKFQTLSSWLRIMRSVDPDRPIKVMTPHLFQAEAMNLFVRYGAYPQLTGEGGSWYRPMHYKGYARLYGLPGSSEPGGATSTARDTQAMFANILWEAQDCHDYVFDLARELWSHPEALKWWTGHKAVLSTIGKVDFGPARVGVLRDVTQDMRFGNGQIWNWDLSRGPLPALGLTPVLIDGPAMEDGLADDVPVIVDCATIVMEPAMVDAVHRYVRRGGIFIAQHHTGESTPEQRDAWPLARSFGLNVSPRFMNQDNPHRWPTAPIRFTEKQDLFPRLRGKSCEGSGVAIDWKDNEYAGAIAIRAAGDHVTPVALWEDGSMAVADVREGQGRFILVGTPFFLRFKDENGKWFNDEQRQALLEDLLAGVGVRRDTGVSDPRVWMERRESKNGLYDVYFAGATGIRDKTWKLEDRIESDLRFAPAGAAPKAAVLASADGRPDVAVKPAGDGWVSLGERAFSPYEIQQYAVLRSRAGLTAPLHWLAVQQRTWRALEPVAPSEADAVSAEAARIALQAGEAGIDLSAGWRMRVDPADASDTAWLTAPADSKDWRDGSMGSWLVQGCPAATCAQYRKRVELPAEWLRPDARVLIGIAGYWPFGIRDRGALWVNGKPVGEGLRGMFSFDITEAAKSGALDLALQVEGKGAERGPVGTLYLRQTPAPDARVDLKSGLERITDWGRTGEALALPIRQKGLFGLQATFEVPADWAGRPVRLVVRSDRGGRQFEGVVINTNGFFRTEDWAPVGPRIDRWLVPGKVNTVSLFGSGFMSDGYKGFDADITAVALEVFPAPKEK